MVTKRSPWSAANAETEFNKLGKEDLVGKPKASRFGGSPPADKRQAAKDQKFFTDEPKATPARYRYGRV
jgi:hypothetical protein